MLSALLERDIGELNYEICVFDQLRLGFLPKIVLLDGEVVRLSAYNSFTEVETIGIAYPFPKNFKAA